MANKVRKVVLFEPFVIEGKDPVTEVTLRKPFSGEMRGLSFSELMAIDVDTMVKLIPRISDLTERDIVYRGGWFFHGMGHPNRIESIYADLSIIFHRQPSEIDKLSIDDLLMIY